MAHTVETDVVVVGSGPGGAGVVRDLIHAGKKVHVLEMGRDVPPLGTAFGGALNYTGGLLGTLSMRQGVLLTNEMLTIMRGVTTGGSSMVYLGTAHDPDPKMWTPFGFDLQAEAEERKEELRVGPLPDKLIGSGAHGVGKAAVDLGYDWTKLNKFVDPDKCVENCNVCIYGCHHGAKWHARDWIMAAVDDGARLLNGHKCEQVLTEGDRAVGVRVTKRDGASFDLHAPTVVLAAGGIGSPAILRKTGIDEAGRSLFFDPFVMTTGVFDAVQHPGAMMATGVHLKEEGILITDLQYPYLVMALQGLMALKPSAAWRYRQSLPLMIKIRDEMTGTIDESLQVTKTLTPSDRDKLGEGKRIATKILEAAGAKDVWHSRVGAAHPGGTCAMGKVVDENLETRFKGLYVCDASVVPVPFGIPPTLTCLALSKRLARHLVGNGAS
jgi:choline dehydrogenase-like flavoprotein